MDMYLEKINEWLDQLSSSSPVVNVSSIGQTYEKRDVMLVTISSSHKNVAGDDAHHLHHFSDEDKPIIYINCGIHAREWVAVSTCIWLIHQVVIVMIYSIYFYNFNKCICFKTAFRCE